MNRKYYLYTIERNGEKKTIVDAHSNPISFLLIEQELGHKTFILYSLELTEEEYQYYIHNRKY